MEQHLLDWLARYGPVVLFLAPVGVIFALPIPDEVLLTVCGALVRKGEFAADAVVVAAIGGCASGTTLSYILGRIVGRGALRKWVLTWWRG
jgi:membrane protein DedA with SNARE-associated domain